MSGQGDDDMQEQSKRKLLAVLTFIVDIFITCFCVNAAMAISNYTPELNVRLYYVAIFLALNIFCFAIYELYSTRAEIVFNVLLSTAIAILICNGVIFVLDLIMFGNKINLLFWVVVFPLHEISMLVWRFFVAFAKKKTGRKNRMLIVENSKNTSRLARKLKYAANVENEAWYCMIDEENEDEVQDLIDNKLPEYDAVFVSPQISSRVSARIVSRALVLQKTVNVLADIYSVTTMKGKIYQIDDTPVIEKKGIYLTLSQRAVKRAFDLVLSAIGCIILSPVFLVCAVLIKLDSKGPVIYKQERYTIHRKVFNCYKFRTMVADAEAHGAQLATENDPRITRVGKILRQLRLDELPQLFDIFLGYMSFVGPRPERPIFADEFSKRVANYDMRYGLKAGLTGYAQVYGKYNTRVSDKILMDMIYGTTYSFVLDVKIILLTIRVMFTKSATEGLDEERDRDLSSNDREEARRRATVESMGGGQSESEDIDNNTGV